MTTPAPESADEGRPFGSHDTSWSANLERPTYETDRARLVEDAMAAIENTSPGYHVNLVTHAAHGDPREYLTAEICEQYPAATTEYVDQCGCGGHVLRVHRPTDA